MKLIGSTDGFIASVEKAFDDIDPNWRAYKGVVITGTHAPEDMEIDDALEAIKEARQSNRPLLGICFGLHLGVIEFARNVLMLPQANSIELDKDTKLPVIDALPGIRVGIRPVNPDRMENHWHRYKVGERWIQPLTHSFKMHVTQETDGEKIVEEMFLYEHKHFVLVQYHPEYNSFPKKPHPILKNFLEACKTP